MSAAGARIVMAALAAATLFLGACANVPLETQPQVIKDVEGPLQQDEDEGPELNLSSSDIVRSYVDANAQSVGHEESRLYLDKGSRGRWVPAKSIVLLEDQFSAVLAPPEEQPDSKNERIVVLAGQQVGTLGVDSAFNPAPQAYENRFRVNRQDDGQWRIVDPPAEVMITLSKFELNYFKVPVYFFAPDGDVRVPDPRYVLAKPQAALPGKVVELLLNGPSGALRNAVANPLDMVQLHTNVTYAADGALTIPLEGASELSDQTKRHIAAQIVLSLESVTTSRVRITSEDVPLLPDQPELRPADLPSYSATALMSAELPGMVVSDGRLVSLGSGREINGPAGYGAYEVATAAQSLEGGQLAVVEKLSKSVRLRVGPVDETGQIVELKGTTLTRPTWRPALSGSRISNELWTVRDGRKVLRVQRTPQGLWTPQEVNANEVEVFGKITALRLSRDGTRAAVVADNKLIVAAVARSPDTVALQAPRVLQPDTLTDVVDVDWLSQETLVVGTKLPGRPVLKVTVDGYRMDRFNSANLSPPITSVAAAPGRVVVASDVRGLWTANGSGEVWRPHPNVQGPSRAVVFYPG